jgi:CoA:oxalate CoA-transferase
MEATENNNDTSTRKAPLDGVRVLDFTRVLAGPFCTAVMADLGAEVIKIESMKGDDYRHVPPFCNEESAFFLLMNRGKKSVVLDLKTEEGRKLVHKLVKTSDVVVENFRPGVTNRLGIDYETCNSLRPNIIYSSVSGFGQNGAMSGLPAYDIIVQAASGLMQSTGFAENAPTLVGEAIGDLLAGLFAAWGVSSALYEREKTGQGRYLDVSMFDCLFTMLPTSIAQWSYGGHLPKRTGNRHPISVPFGTYVASDGHFVLAILNDGLFTHFLDIIGQGALVNDGRLNSDDARSNNEPFVRGLVENWSKDLTVDEVVTALSEAKIPAGPIWNIEQAIDSNHVRERRLVTEVDHQTVGKVLVLEQPVHFTGQKRGQIGAPPILGEHTYDVLRDLCNLSLEQLTELNDRGVILSSKA